MTSDCDDLDSDDASLPDLPGVDSPATVTEHRDYPETRPHSITDGSTSPRGSRGSKGKGKAGGRGGRAKSRSGTETTSSSEETIQHGIVRKGALQSALKSNQRRQENDAGHLEATEMRPSSSSIHMERKKQSTEGNEGNDMDRKNGRHVYASATTKHGVIWS